MDTPLYGSTEHMYAAIGLLCTVRFFFFFFFVSTYRVKRVECWSRSFLKEEKKFLPLWSRAESRPDSSVVDYPLVLFQRVEEFLHFKFIC